MLSFEGIKAELSVLLITNSNALLSTSIYELFIRDEIIERAYQVSTTADAVEHIQEVHYNLIISFVTYPMSLFLEKLSEIQPKAKVLLVLNPTDHIAMPYLSKFEIDGLISKDSTYQELIIAINLILQNEYKYISPVLVSNLSKSNFIDNPFSSLSTKEIDVALFIISGKRIMDIAKEMNISHKTVSTYKSRIYKKFEIESDLQLFRFASKYGLEF